MGANWRECPYCGERVAKFNHHIRKRHPEKSEEAGVGPRPQRQEKTSYTMQPEQPEQTLFEAKSPEDLQKLVDGLPSDEFVLQQQMEDAEKKQKPRVIAGKPVDEILERRKIKLNKRLNEWMGKLTADPAVDFLDKFVKARKQPDLTTLEKETMKDGFDVLMEVIGLEFDIEPFLMIITSRWIALLFAPIVIGFTLFFRPGLVAERMTRPREDKANDKK